MDAIWKRTYDALSQLRRDIADGNDAGTRHFSDGKRLVLLRAIDAVRDDAASCARLGTILLAPNIKAGRERVAKLAERDGETKFAREVRAGAWDDRSDVQAAIRGDKLDGED